MSFIANVFTNKYSNYNPIDTTRPSCLRNAAVLTNNAHFWHFLKFTFPSTFQHKTALYFNFIRFLDFDTRRTAQAGRDVEQSMEYMFYGLYSSETEDFLPLKPKVSNIQCLHQGLCG